MKRMIAVFAACLLLLPLLSCGNEAEAEKKTETVNGTETEKKQDGTVLLYDDRYLFEAEVTSVATRCVTSDRCGSTERDDAVLVRDMTDPRGVIATGIGEAEVTLSDGNTVNVTVRPAPLRLLLLLGQSNAEGMTVGTDEAVSAEARSRSVRCQPGTVYSTYAPCEAKYGVHIGGVPFTEGLTARNADRFVAASLTGTVSRSGDPLEYPLDRLTAADGGKAGMDSAIAWEWNRKSGEKVWVINAAHSGSAISTWQKDGSDNNFAQAVSLTNACLAVVADEVASGHYTYAGLGYFWLQGCADRSMTAERYTELFLAMHRALKEDLSAFPASPSGRTLDFGGVVLVRESTGALTPLDLRLNGPRAAQLWIAGNTDEVCGDICLASALGDRFVTDRGVEMYFREKYPSGQFDFVTRSAYPLPITASTVHPDIHYRQPGYNALGIDAADGALDFLNQKSGDGGLHVLSPDGFSKYADGDELVLHAGESRYFAALTDDASGSLSGIRFEVEMDGATFRYGMLTVPSTVPTGRIGELRVNLGNNLRLTLRLRTE